MQNPEKSTPNNARHHRKTTEKSSTQEPPVNDPVTIQEIPLVSYDITLIDEFFNTVFHTLPSETACIMGWKVNVGSHPMLPLTDSRLLDALEKTRKPYALYYGTSTVSRDPVKKQPRNRKDLFEALHVVVLDDIGTKISVDKIPEAFKPSYIVETSEDNFQFGYVLESPITDINAATALIQLVYNAGFSDAGGKMATKLVRIPAGVNGKAGKKRDFLCNLVELTDKRWTPEDILHVLDIPLKWSEIVENADVLRKVADSRKVGSSPWSPITSTAASLDGIIDPVLEWLYDEGLVKNDNGDWVNIQCPNAANHTTGDDLAGYKPIGRGKNPERRGFHCFHDACATQGTMDFLHYVSTNSGLVVGATDHAAYLTAEWIYDAVEDTCWRIKNTEYPVSIPIKAFRNLYPRKINVVDDVGAAKKVLETYMWLTSASRVTVYGSTFVPSTPERIVTIGGEQKLNRFSPVAYPDGSPDMAYVDRFLAFLTYLIPSEFERKYFLDWVTCKVKDVGFRGNAIVMIAKKQGIGRTTLSDMLGELVGLGNSTTMPYDKVIGDSVYNEFMVSPLVIVNETKQTTTESPYAAYEKLKEIVDPRPKKTLINPKYGKQYYAMVHSSYVFFTNHEDGLVVPDTDRRLFVLSNNEVQETPEYFDQLNQWLVEPFSEEFGEAKAWAVHVWRWFNRRRADPAVMCNPAPMTDDKNAMQLSTKPVFDQFINILLDVWPTEYVSYADIQEYCEQFAHINNLFETPNWRSRMKKIVNLRTQGFNVDARVTSNNRRVRPRIITSKVTMKTVRPDDAEDPRHVRRLRIAFNDSLLALNTAQWQEELRDALNLADL